jgi:SAM-dependent methyltransferase
MTDWEQAYIEGNVHWNRGAVSPPLQEWIARAGRISGRILVPGSGPGHEVGFLYAAGMDVWGLDIAPTGIQLARQNYPQVPAQRWLCEDLFAMSAELKSSFDAVVEHTCLSGMPPEWRPAYAEAVLSALKPNGVIVGVWFINPDLDEGETGPPYPLAVEELNQLFAERAVILEDYVPEPAFSGREGRERVRVLRKL